MLRELNAARAATRCRHVRTSRWDSNRSRRLAHDGRTTNRGGPVLDDLETQAESNRVNKCIDIADGKEEKARPRMRIKFREGYRLCQGKRPLNSVEFWLRMHL